MELKDYVTALRDRWYLLIILAVVGAIGGYIYAATQPDLYRATTSAFVSSQRGDTVSELVQGSQYTQSQMQSYANLATTPAVLEPVIDELGLTRSTSELADAITAQVELNTVILSVSVVDTDPAKSADVANAVMDSLSTVVSELSPRDGDRNPSIVLTTVTPATVPPFPFAPNTRLLVITGAMLGILAAVVYAVLKRALDTRIRSEQDAVHSTDIPFLGAVPRPTTTGVARLPGKRQARAKVPWEASGQSREAYRRLAANLDFADIDREVRMIVVSSALPGEGKTTTSVNLALALAERRHRVLLLDADLRRPRVAEMCGLDGTVGLTTVLIHQASLAEAVQPWGKRNVDILASGVRPPNPTEIISSDAMLQLLEEAKMRYDFVVVDSAPVLPVSDTLTLARIAGASLLVGRYKVTRRQSLTRAVEMLSNAGARVVGFVLNAVPPRQIESGYYEEDGPKRRSTTTPAEPASVS